jgi:hypothetical protein
LWLYSLDWTHKGANSRWHANIEALPPNVSQVAQYWTKEELDCIVPRHSGRKHPEFLQSTLSNFHTSYIRFSLRGLSSSRRCSTGARTTRRMGLSHGFHSSIRWNVDSHVWDD